MITSPQNTFDKASDYSATYGSSADLAANTAGQIFSAAANVNGAIVYMFEFSGSSAGNYRASLLAKATAPTAITDGDILTSGILPAASNGSGIKLAKPVFVAAGKGLFRVNDSLTTGCIASCVYKLL